MEFKYFPLFFVGLISGIIIFQSSVIPPSINKLLNEQDASRYLRYIWPRFFVIVSLLSLICFILILIFSPDQYISQILSIVSSFIMIICYIAVPFMNKARDMKKEKTFFIMHTGSVLLTFIALIINISIFFVWN